MVKMPQWYPFDKELGADQRLPKEYENVLVRIIPKDAGLPHGYAVGYLRYDTHMDGSPAPFFVVSGIAHAAVSGWCRGLHRGMVESLDLHDRVNKSMESRC